MTAQIQYNDIEKMASRLQIGNVINIDGKLQVITNRKGLGITTAFQQTEDLIIKRVYQVIGYSEDFGYNLSPIAQLPIYRNHTNFNDLVQKIKSLNNKGKKQ